MPQFKTKSKQSGSQRGILRGVRSIQHNRGYRGIHQSRGGDNESKGNIILSYYNMGHVQRGTDSGQHVAAMLRRQPSFAFGCSEATEDLKEMIEGPPQAAITANRDLSDKKEFHYTCVLQQHVDKKKYDRRAHNLRVGYRGSEAPDAPIQDQEQLPAITGAGPQ